MMDCDRVAIRNQSGAHRGIVGTVAAQTPKRTPFPFPSRVRSRPKNAAVSEREMIKEMQTPFF